ncbi:MAG: hypothetical protein AAGC60_18690 [Acidobacteriota bacterium]
MKVHLFAMKTWGELGNLLAAKTLAACLAESDDPNLEIEVFETERFMPRFAHYGERIAAIIKDRSLDVPTRIACYHALMEEIGDVFYPGFETDEPIRGPVADELGPLAEHLSSHRPDLVLGTKGVIARVLHAATQRSSADPVVANFVTNEGLLTLPIHRSTTIRHHFVPFESGRRLLLERYGYGPDLVRAVGRLIAHAHVSSVTPQATDSVLPAAAPAAAQTEHRIIVFSNRGGSPYLDLLRTIGESGTRPSVLFIGYNDPDLVAGARALQAELDADNWHVVERLGQGDYIKSIRWLSHGRYPLLLSKTGPNTMLEATYFGIPQLLLGSGLPAEEWVGPFVEEHGFGLSFRTMDALCETLAAWLADPEEIARRRAVAERFSRDLMNQQTVGDTIRSSILSLARTNELVATEQPA